VGRDAVSGQSFLTVETSVDVHGNVSNPLGNKQAYTWAACHRSSPFQNWPTAILIDPHPCQTALQSMYSSEFHWKDFYGIRFHPDGAKRETQAEFTTQWRLHGMDASAGRLLPLLEFLVRDQQGVLISLLTQLDTGV